MKTGLGNLTFNKDENNFTTDFGIKARRLIDKPFRKLLRLASKKEIIIDYYPELEKGKPYIFVSNHSFFEDIQVALASIDRSAYVLFGSTDQIDHNFGSYAAFVNGMIYVDRLDNESRKLSVKKMERILNSGSSILLFPEGGWNNSENSLVLPLFNGPYTLSKDTGFEVVPICCYTNDDMKDIHVKVGKPMSFKDKDNKEALTELRDTLATMTYESIEEYSTPIEREVLDEKYHMRYMEMRDKEYKKAKWSSLDRRLEELTVRKDKEHPTPREVLKTFDNVKVTSLNAGALAGLLVEREKLRETDFEDYVRENWNRKK